MKLLTVTREQGLDKRYGLGKSLAPVVECFPSLDIEHCYLTQDDLGEKSRLLQNKLKATVGRFLQVFSADTDMKVMTSIVVERLNMGRLAAKVAAKERFTHVHCHDPIIAAGFRFFKRFVYRNDARWGVTEHGFGSYTQAIIDEGVPLGYRVIRWLKRWERTTLLAADWVVSPTHLSLKQLQRDLDVAVLPDSWHKVPHPCPQLQRYDYALARQQLGWPLHRRVVLGVGRLVPLKQFDLLLEAVLRFPELHLVLLGHGDETALRERARVLGAESRLIITNTDDVGLFLSAADFYVSTSVTESFGMANLEALSAGVPVICTAVGGVPEVMGQAAHLIPAGDLSALCEALEALEMQPQLRSGLTERGRLRAAQWPSAIHIAQTYQNIYSGCGSKLDQAQRIPSKIDSGVFQYWLKRLEGFSLCPLPVQVVPVAERVLVFAPHQDDETIGCGGTLASLKQAGAAVRVVVITDGAQGYPQGFAPSKVVAARRVETLAAAGMLGVDDVAFWDEPDASLTVHDELSAKVYAQLEAFKPDRILIPSVMDSHKDHVAAALAVLQAWENSGCNGVVWMYEVWTPLPVTHVVNVSNVYSTKMAALNCYKIPLSCMDYSAYVRGLNSYRGIAFDEPNTLAEGFLELPVDGWRGRVEQLIGLRGSLES